MEALLVKILGRILGKFGIFLGGVMDTWPNEGFIKTTKTITSGALEKGTLCPELWNIPVS